MRLIRNQLLTATVTLSVLATVTLGSAWVFAAPDNHAPATEQVEVELVAEAGSAGAAVYYAIAVCVAVACLSAGYAVGKVGAAAMGAAAEHPEIMGRALIFVGLAEGIAIYGLIVGIMLILRL
jgi:V/A-type H+-transporting ATPase subunit K